MPGCSAVAATRQPASRPPPPTGITSASRSGASSSSSSASVPWPAITAGSSYGWMKTSCRSQRPVAAACAAASASVSPCSTTVAPQAAVRVTLVDGVNFGMTMVAAMPSELRMPRHRLRVVAGRHGDDAARPLVGAEQGQPVGGAALLEGAGDLQIVELQRHVGAGRARDGRRWASSGVRSTRPAMRAGGRLHVGEVDHARASRIRDRQISASLPAVARELVGRRSPVPTTCDRGWHRTPRPNPLPQGEGESPCGRPRQLNFSSRISYDRSPPGAGTDTVSPTFLPISALASGEEIDSRADLDVGLVHADDLVGGLPFRSPRRPAGHGRRTSRGCRTGWTGRSPRRAEMISSSSAMRPSMKDWRSRAAWYSAFSDRSPCARASAMARMMAGRSSDLSARSSSSNRCRPGRGHRKLLHVGVLRSAMRNVAWVTWPYAAAAAGAVPAAAERSERSAKVGLQRRNFKRSRFQGRDGVHRRPGAGHGRVVRHDVGQRAAADGEAVGDRLRGGGGVDRPAASRRSGSHRRNAAGPPAPC